MVMIKKPITWLAVFTLLYESKLAIFIYPCSRGVFTIWNLGRWSTWLVCIRNVSFRTKVLLFFFREINNTAHFVPLTKVFNWFRNNRRVSCTKKRTFIDYIIIETFSILIRILYDDRWKESRDCCRKIFNIRVTRLRRKGRTRFTFLDKFINEATYETKLRYTRRDQNHRIIVNYF